MHAVLITAYKDFPALERIVARLDPAFFRVFVHLDARSPIGASEIARLTALRCRVVKKYRIRWGAITHLYAILHLLKLASEAPDCDYMHIVTGQDYPVASVEEFMTRCDGRIFMRYQPLDEAPDYIRDRYRRYNIFYFLQNGDLPFSGRLYHYLDRFSLSIQQRFGIYRRALPPFDTIYKGIVWMSLPRAAVRKIIGDAGAETFLKTIRTTYVAEEIFFQTVLLNSVMAPKVVRGDLRYTDWSRRNGSVPAYLDGSDVDVVLQSKSLFARKVSTEISQDFLVGIDQAIFAET